jgi:alpha-glucuronidase
LEGKIDPERFEEVRRRLQIQADNARQWRDVCLEYFGRFANPIEKQKADR